MIEASFAQQYGIRLRQEDDMSWGEFVTLLAGINGDTPLGGIVAIRSEKDPKRIKEFSREQRRIFNDWKFRKTNEEAQKMSRKEYDIAMKQLEQMMSGFSSKK